MNAPRRSLTPTIGLGIGMGIGGLSMAAIGTLPGTERAVIYLYVVGAVSGAVLGAIVGSRWERRRSRTG